MGSESNIFTSERNHYSTICIKYRRRAYGKVYLIEFFQEGETMTLNEIIEEYMPTDQAIRDITEFFAVFSHETRIKLLSLLAISPLNVGEIGKALNLNQTTVSHQLRILKDRRIIIGTRKGKEIVYAIANDGVNEILFQAVKATESRTETLADLLAKSVIRHL